MIYRLIYCRRRVSPTALLCLCLLSLIGLSLSFVPETTLIHSHKRAPVAITTMSAKSDALFESTMSLTSVAAEKALAAAQQEAESNGWAVTIAIADAGGVPLLVKRLDGAFAASYEIAVGKAKTTAYFKKNTGQLESAANVSDGSSRTALLSAPFVLMQGGVPIIINGQCCGSVGVSGVKPDEDERVAIAAVKSLTSINSRL